MKLNEIKPALKELFAELSGLDIVWENEPRPFTSDTNDAIVLLNFNSVTGLGRDEIFTHFDPTQTNEEFADEHRGFREATLTIKVEALLQTDNGDAHFHLERIRNRLLFRSVVSRLNAVGCAFIRAERVVDLGASYDDRNRSVAAMDVFLTIRTSTTDLDKYGYIATAEITGNYEP